MRNGILTALLFMGLNLLSAAVIANEPNNLTLEKRALKQYHDSGEYDRDISKVAEQALRFARRVC